MDQSGAAQKRHAVAISTTRVCLKSAELFYEPSGLAAVNDVRGMLLRDEFSRSD